MLKKIKSYIDGIKSGNRFFLSKTITIIESSHKFHNKLSQNIINKLIPYSGNTVRIGITGVPGVGKSTFIENFGLMLVKKGYKLAVLAIDPSSNISGGSIMGDKTRMNKLSKHPNAFIRPSPSSGTLGGVTKKTKDILTLCEAAGFDIIIIETVGVGQSETMVSSMVDFFLVLILSGAGDELQGIKKGIIEIADALVINKADGNNIINSQNTKKSYERALGLFKSKTPNWLTPIIICSSIIPSGLETIWNQIITYHKKTSKSGNLNEKRRNQSIEWMWSSIKDEFNAFFFETPKIKNMLKNITTAVKYGKISPKEGSNKLISSIIKKTL